ncbi:MAG TPA: DUF6778 family protein [Paracoccaceae bacterium]|nr:DUF6778 family protein [Paracoccaceae bacterium]
MRAVKRLAILALVLGLSACGAADQVSRATVGPAVAVSASTGPGTAESSPALEPLYNVAEVRVVVPRDLSVSEANLFYPVADIVWRGEPLGDRHQQVHAILTEAAGFATASMKEGRAVMIVAEVVRFHSLTEKTRYTVGGVHSLRYRLSVHDAATGEVIEPPRLIVADVRAAGGRRAIEEERQGRTQRVVVVSALANSLRAALSTPIAPLPEAPQVSQAAPALAPSQPAAL